MSLFPRYPHDLGSRRPQIADLRAFTQPVAGTQKHSMNAIWMNHVGASIEHVKPRFRKTNAVEVTNVMGTPKVPLFTDEYPTDRSPMEAPIPDGLVPAEAGDAHVLIVDHQEHLLYELEAASRESDGWHCAASICWDLRSVDPLPLHMTSADAAGLPITPGLLRKAEVDKGWVGHAIRTTFPNTANACIPPACHYAGQDTAQLPPMGARLRLNRGWYLDNAAAFTGPSRVVLDALRRFGLILADNGGAFYVNGAGDWDGDDPAYLKLYYDLAEIPGTAFEFVASAPIQK